ncbi:hypothetical protein JQ592_01655 [Bradyrhizobium iriomotense]|nr:hypothetical protein [Bradyrhizobium iriomotense]MBR1126975.1 hypothetical protein [Bradyrhizobium iriomotense]
MRSVTLLALSLVFVGAWSHDSARGQTSVAPPVSLAPPDASPPRPSARNSKPRGEPGRVTTDRTPPAAPNPAADYDGFSVGTVDDNDTPSRVTPPVRSRAAKDSKSNLDDLDQEDGALKRKLMICQNCK